MLNYFRVRAMVADWQERTRSTEASDLIMDRLRKRYQALDVPCDRCEAPPFSPCVTPAGRPTPRSHRQRTQRHESVIKAR
jgi:hypothetical protein